jgi:hypothetical protein
MGIHSRDRSYEDLLLTVVIGGVRVTAFRAPFRAPRLFPNPLMRLHTRTPRSLLVLIGAMNCDRNRASLLIRVLAIVDGISCPKS